jgi:hypothetical protein
MRNVDPALVRYKQTAARLADMERRDDAAPIIVPLSDGRTLAMVSTVPRTRADCPVERPCQHINCREHLWLIQSQDRQGRRVDGRAPGSTLRLAPWRQTPIAPSCGLDLADAGPMSIDDVGRALGLKSSRVHEHEASGLRKLRAEGLDLRSLLEEM